MIKICHVTSAHNRYDDRILEKECKSLAKKGYDTTLIVNDSLPDEIVSGVKIVSTNLCPSSRIDRIFRSKELLRKAMSIGAEIYHLHDPELLLIAKKLKKLGKKVIFDSHEFYGDQIRAKDYLKGPLKNIIGKLYDAYESKVLKEIDGLIYVCKKTNGDKIVDEYKDRCKNVAIVANYPLEVTNNTAQRDTWGNRKMKVCYAGSLSANRGIEKLIDACYYANVELVLAGVFESESFEKYLKSKPSYECVDYRGIVSLKEVYAIYEEADVGAQLLLDIGQYYKLAIFGVKVYEYMQMHLPVIINNAPYNIKMIEKYKFGISVNPQNINEIVDAINYLKENPRLANAMGENGYKLCIEKFQWSVAERNLIELYETISNNN